MNIYIPMNNISVPKLKCLKNFIQCSWFSVSIIRIIIGHIFPVNLYAVKENRERHMLRFKGQSQLNIEGKR